MENKTDLTGVFYLYGVSASFTLSFVRGASDVDFFLQLAISGAMSLLSWGYPAGLVIANIVR